jgi:hypothetical protein
VIDEARRPRNVHKGIGKIAVVVARIDEVLPHVKRFLAEVDQQTDAV